MRWGEGAAATTARIPSKGKGPALEPAAPVDGQPVTVEKPEPAPVPPQLAAHVGSAAQEEPAPSDEEPGDAPPKESARAMYRRRLREALASLPGGVDEGAA